MGKPVESKRTPWELAIDERRFILLGLALSATTSALFPLAQTAFRASTRWIGDPQHVDSKAIPSVSFLIVALVVFLWPGPMLLQWWKSFRQGINHGSFVIPALALSFILVLRYWMPLLLWCITVPIIGLIVIWFLSASYQRSAALELNDDRTDDERRLLEEAWPERRALAKEIADHILEEGKATYAIYGGFGSGKSSMLNFIYANLIVDPDRRPIIVRFNGWLPGSQENLADQLLSDIATECASEYYIPNFRRTAARVAKTLTTSVPHIAWLTEWIPQETQKDAIDGLREALGRLPRRVVVLVDEIDRMRKDELIVLLKIIRGFTSLPRLSFVCALERSQVEKLIQAEYGAIDHTFYHKFFVESFELPKLVDSFLENETCNALTAIFEEQGWFARNEQAKRKYSELIHELWKYIFAPLCTNTREVKRLAYSVRSQSWPLVDEVNPLDLTLLAALRYFAQPASELIWSFRDILCAHDIDGSIPNPDLAYETSVSSFLEHEGKLVSNVLLQEQAKRIRRVLFTGLDEIMDAQGTDSKPKLNAELRYFDRNKQAARTKGLRSSSYFPAYFQNILPIEIFPERDLSRVFDEIRQSDGLKAQQVVFKELKQLEGNGGKRLNFLDKLTNNAVQSLDLGKCSLVANVLVGRSSGLDDPLSEREYSQTARFVTGVCDEMFLAGRIEDRLRLLRQCILGARADGVAFRILSWAGKRPMPEAILATQEGIQSVLIEYLEKIYLDRMEKQYGPSVGLKEIDLNFSYWLAFSEWGVMLEKSVWANQKDMQRNFWIRYISSRERMANFVQSVLIPFYMQTNGGIPTMPLWKNVLPEGDIRDLARTFPPYQDQLALSCLKELFGADVVPEPVKMGLSTRISTTRSGPLTPDHQ